MTIGFDMILCILFSFPQRMTGEAQITLNATVANTNIWFPASILKLRSHNPTHLFNDFWDPLFNLFNSCCILNRWKSAGHPSPPSSPAIKERRKRRMLTCGCVDKNPGALLTFGSPLPYVLAALRSVSSFILSQNSTALRKSKPALASRTKPM